jgi:transcription elongation factor GreA
MLTSGSRRLERADKPAKQACRQAEAKPERDETLRVSSLTPFAPALIISRLMTDKNQELVTPEGLEKLQNELVYLTDVRRREVADRIRQAREFGDISENSEYDEAKNEQGLLERRIGELQRRIRNVKVVDPSETEQDAVDLGTRVTLRVVGNGQERTFQIVGANESDPTSGKLSHASPVGKAVLKKKVGEKVMVSTPRGATEYEIVNVEAAS